MNSEEISLALQRVEDRARANTHRLERLEGQAGAVGEIAKNICVISEKLNALNVTFSKLEQKVTALESAPAKKWEKVSLRVLEALVAAAVGFFLAKIGL